MTTIKITKQGIQPYHTTANMWQYTHCDWFHKTATTYIFLTLKRF